MWQECGILAVVLLASQWVAAARGEVQGRAFLLPPPDAGGDAASLASTWHHAKYGRGLKELLSRSAHSLLHGRAQSTLAVPLEVNVVLVGMAGDGAYRYDMDTEALAFLLQRTFDSHRPACVDAQEELVVQHTLSFNVVKATSEELLQVEEQLHKQMQQQLVQGGGARVGSAFQVEATALEPLFDQMYTSLFDAQAQRSTATQQHTSAHQQQQQQQEHGGVIEGKEGSAGAGVGQGQHERQKAARQPAAIFICSLDKVRLDPYRAWSVGPLPTPRANASTASSGGGGGAARRRSLSRARLTHAQLQAQEANYSYAYAYNGAGHAQIWLSHGRYVVVDLSAGPTQYGPLMSTEGVVGALSLPRVRSVMLPEPSATSAASLAHNPSHMLLSTADFSAAAAASAAPTAGSPSEAGLSSRPVSEEYFRGVVSRVIVSATEHLLSPDIRFENMDAAHRVLVAIIVLTNHAHFNPLTPGHAHSLDLNALEKEMHAMGAPGQDVVLVGGLHHLHDHQRLAMAVEAAIEHRSHTLTLPNGTQVPHTRSVLDASLLLEEFRESADLLASGLLEAAHPSLSDSVFVKRHSQPSAAGKAQQDDVSEGIIRRRSRQMSAHQSSTGDYSDHPQEQQQALQHAVQKRRQKHKQRHTIMPVKRNWDAHVTLRQRTKSRARRRVDSQLARAHGTRVLPVFVLSLAGFDPSLLLDGDTLYFAAPDSVLVLQTVVNHSIPISFMSAGRQVHMDPRNSLQRSVVAGAAAVLGGLAAPYEDLSVRRGHAVMRQDWLWAVGHHPFGPLSNTSSISALLHDVMLTNGVFSRIHAAVQFVRATLEEIDTFAARFLVTPFGAAVKTHRAATSSSDSGGDADAGSSSSGGTGAGMSEAAVRWLEAMYGDPTRPTNPLLHGTVQRLMLSLEEFESRLVELSGHLYEQQLHDAHTMSLALLSFADAFHEYAKEELGQAQNDLRCCQLKHRYRPPNTSPALLYGLILVVGFLVYFTVILFGSRDR